MKPSRISYKLASLITLLLMIGMMIPQAVANAATGTLTFKPVADAYVTSKKPTGNFGKSKGLAVHGSAPVIRSYLRFKVAGLKGANVTSAKLRFYVTNDSHSGFTVYSVPSTTWKELSITYKKSPKLGNAIASIGSYAVNTWIEIDITGAVTKDGLYSFALVSDQDTTTSVASRNAGTTKAPQLVLTYDGAAVPTQAPTKAPTKAPTASPTKAPTKAPTAVPPSGSSNQPYGVSGSWNLKFSDEFNGSSLNTSKWEPNWLAGNVTTITKPINGNEESCYDPALATVSGGNLNLKAVARSCKASNGTTYKYAAGMVTTSGRYTFTYGYMEARVWLDGSSSVKNWPAFWADGTGTWPTTGEIDVMEGLGGSPAWHFHWGSPSSAQQVGGAPSMSTKTGWHIFGADWEKGSIKFYYDGKLVGTVTSGVTSSPMFLILNLGVSNSISGPIQVPSQFNVDYVRVWQH